MPFTCVLVGQGRQLVACADVLLARGHAIKGVISDCPVVGGWTQKTGIPRIGTTENQLAFLSREPFDYLFSIVNHAITPADIRALPVRGAINYHDARLPEYSGFNATAWSILDGRTVHGVTWHRMTDDVDQGEILVQTPVPIAYTDTAFSLAAQCSGVAVRGFEQLLGALETGTAQAVPPSTTRSFHFRSERPGLAVLDWGKPAAELHRLVRALDFGTEDNWMASAKFLTPAGDLVVVGAAARGAASGGTPGTVGAVRAGALEVATADGGLVLSDLATIEGDPLTDDDLRRLGVVPGAHLPAFDAAALAAAQALDARITKVERFFVKQLATLHDPQLADLKAHEHGGPLGHVALALPGGLSPADLPAALGAALAAYVFRQGEDVDAVDVGLLPGALAPGQERAFADVLPLRISVSATTPFAQLRASVREEIAARVQRQTYARDVWRRYGALRNKPEAQRRLSLAVGLHAFSGHRLPAGVRLLFACGDGQAEIVFDSASIRSAHVERLAARVATLLAAGLRADAPVGDLDIVPPGEADLLLRAWQNTDRAYPKDKCVHHLFAEQVARTPDATAVVFRDQSLTYRQLEDRANALAVVLRARGVGPERLVGICVERSLHMVVGLLAILKAGGAYFPMDPAYPRERLAMMLEDSGAELLLTESHLDALLPLHRAQTIHLDGPLPPAVAAPLSSVSPDNLAYVIFTSGSTGRPKGVMVLHRNVVNFFAGMDDVIGTTPGTWLAVTSISFDISVLEIFWTLCRGFEVVIQEAGDRSTMRKAHARPVVSARPMAFSLFYFAADSTSAPATDAYRLLLDGARFADTHGFTAVWTPERHFHAFGGLYPNPAVTSAALAVITKQVELRGGSVVIPLHDPIRVAEEWAVVDNLSHGRVGLSFASGWHVNDFALQPQNYERRREVMQESIEKVLKLWSGGSIKAKNGVGQDIEVSVLPRPVRERPPMWIASAGNIETFRAAGRGGFNVLTNMLGQDLDDLRAKFAAYRAARAESGHAGEGVISVMVHTFVTDDDDKARALARKPFGNYLAASYDLVKVAPWMFPAFKQPSQAKAGTNAFDAAHFDADDMAALLDHAFDRYFDTAGLFGTPERALKMVESLKDIGADEVACLIDFGIDPDVVLSNLVHLDRLRQLANSRVGADDAGEPAAPIEIADQFRARAITHLQCTPSLARMLVADGTIAQMKSLKTILLGGEALPVDLAERLSRELPAQLINMYGPTETTVWSTTSVVDKAGGPITIGRPIANTKIRIVDRRQNLLPVGVPGELCIGGDGVVRGYLGRPDLTADRFVPDAHGAPGARMYRTGDLARYREDGSIDFIGRIDQQVKVAGHRIELGEIESVLSKHPGVKQTVVAVKDAGRGPELVGYVIAAGAEGVSGAADVETWQKRWNEAYTKSTGADPAAARFNTSGWLDSATGEPIAQPVMRQWLDQTIARILACKPKRVLEIGCGTGMILYGCLPHVEHYTAVDVSPVALETIRNELTLEERRKVTLLHQAAHDLEALAPGSCDLVIINSVAQYFPDAAYLTKVLARAAEILVDGGHVFVGDVRSLEEERAMHTWVELHHAPGQARAEDLGRRIAERSSEESELLIAAGFFETLSTRVPRLSLRSTALKQAPESSEMREFRSDVVLHAGPPLAKLALAPDELHAPASVDLIARALGSKPAALHVAGLRNPRLSRLHAAAARIDAKDNTVLAEGLRKDLALPGDGVDPNDVFALAGTDYTVETRFGERAGEWQALFRRVVDPRAEGRWPVVATAGPLTNTPHSKAQSDTLVPKLKAHLKDFVPDYMVPSAFVFLSEFPLTPNGKIDRKALPLPAEKAAPAAAAYVVPSNELERTIAGIWQELLGVPRVGRKDNIFDLGASSLLTVEANQRLQTALGHKIPLVTMFRYPTIDTLAAHLGRVTAPAAEAAAPVVDTAEQDRQNRLNAAAERRRRARSQSQ